MTSAREHDIILRRLVAQFRRLARRVAGDPSALVPPDPAAALLALGVPVEALLDMNPLERLRGSAHEAPADEVAAPLDVAARDRAATVRRSPAARPLPQDSASHRPALVRSAAALGIPEKQGDASAAASAVALPWRTRESGARAPSAQPAPRPNPVATLAERRAAARRGSAAAHAQAPSPRHAALHAALAQPGPGAPAQRTHETSMASLASPAADPSVAPAPTRVTRSSAPSESRSTRPAELPIRASRAAARGVAAAVPVGAAARAPVLTDAAPAPSAPRQAPEASAPASGTSGSRGTSGDVGVTRGAASRAPQPLQSRPAASERGAADGAGERADASVCELGDDLFEALYRAGVDLSWP